MDLTIEGAKDRPCWFVGSSFEGGRDDQTERFIREGIWINGCEEKYTDLVKSVRVGDRIAMKSAYTRKRNLPFDNKNNLISVMGIKAIGTVTENPGDGHNLKVAWTALNPHREWYFSTSRTTIWRVTPGNWKTDGLIAFTFEGKEQDIDRFRNAPQWRERFDDGVGEEKQFQWTHFYEEFADKLLTFRHRREELMAGLHAIGKKFTFMTPLSDRYEKDGPDVPLKDICPFTVMGSFNRGITWTNRQTIAQELAKLVGGVSASVPDSFEGIPILNPQQSRLFWSAFQRQEDDIDVLWEVFARAIALTESGDEEARSAFISSYDDAIQRQGVKWNLTMGLYWIRPWFFLPLDGYSRNHISNTLKVAIKTSGAKKICSASEYLELMDTLEASFEEDNFPVHSFPELSVAAWPPKESRKAADPDTEEYDVREEETVFGVKAGDAEEFLEPYDIDSILSEGCFLPREKLQSILNRLREKKNLILQGPPGTGKTWLARRLAFALIGHRDDRKVRALQFHPNLSYEDFIRGWRPGGDGKLTLVDGPFMEMIGTAQADPGADYAVVIEEINRGNPAQIFGEMLTLLEADKRKESEALELSYRQSAHERVYIPDNLYVIGTMNIADRSLALVDLALRRRFAFIDLEPTLGSPWRTWVQKQNAFDPDALEEIKKRFLALNAEIASDPSLGAQFRIGHSYLIPPAEKRAHEITRWFVQVVETEIVPLLDEYWFDAPAKSKKMRDTLLEGFCQ